MNIQLKQLIIHNFKGILDLAIDFNLSTEISGKNASFKTSISDGYYWLLYDKNSNDKETFNIKNTKDLSLNKLNHEVTGVFDIDGAELILNKIYRENWVTKRGESIKELKGHENIYSINGIPKSQKEYQAKVNDLLNESIAKLITNPFSFNALKWEARREVLVKIAGNPSDKDIAFMNADFTLLIESLNGKNLADAKKEIASKKKKIRETLDYIPSRIDEAELSKPQHDDFDFIEKSIENKTKLIAKVDEAITDKVKAHRDASAEIIKKQNELNRLKMELSNLKAEAKRNHQNQVNALNLKISAFERDKNNSESEILRANTKIDALRKKIDVLNSENAELRKKWSEVNAELIGVINPETLMCPVCKQQLPQDRIGQIVYEFESNFTKDKSKRLTSINQNGQQRKDFITSFQSEINDLETAIEASKQIIENADLNSARLKEDLQTLANLPDKTTPEIQELIGKIELGTNIMQDAPVIDDAELKQRKNILNSEITDLRFRFLVKEQIKKSELRITELETQERDLSQEIADLEKTEFTIEAFTRAKMDEVEKRVNSMFKSVKFRMFTKQINGGIDEDCVCLVDGVPFADANTAAQINAGLDIINTLQGFYNVYAPVWIDRAESVNEFFALASQLVKLIVTLEPLKIS